MVLSESIWTQPFIRQVLLTSRNKDYLGNDTVLSCPDMDWLLIDLDESRNYIDTFFYS